MENLQIVKFQWRRKGRTMSEQNGMRGIAHNRIFFGKQGLVMGIKGNMIREKFPCTGTFRIRIQQRAKRGGVKMEYSINECWDPTPICSGRILSYRKTMKDSEKTRKSFFGVWVVRWVGEWGVFGIHRFGRNALKDIRVASKRKGGKSTKITKRPI